MVPNDPVMLLSFVNMKLRDFYPNFESMCEDMDVDRHSIEAKLAQIGFYYDSEKNQFA